MNIRSAEVTLHTDDGQTLRFYIAPDPEGNGSVEGEVTMNRGRMELAPVDGWRVFAPEPISRVAVQLAGILWKGAE